ncbi:FG-GAP-like repeat-containing protein [Streptomyces acidiscabies]|uniref:FG-GAP-like repeat-containing protein n=2 Tax=Streptomyces acidiscabies TaxID=42234 RepID=UPI00073E7581|nr:FG-GAP-like repeat-containing protein [Streptomyces acidiscabies]GAQ57778.1 FG-GAP repeat protein [Streptomyces acidiscabies]
MRTRTRLTLAIGLVLAALTVALLPWWHPDDPPTPAARGPVDARKAEVGPRDEAAAVAESRRTGKAVAVDTATTATELTWALPDGRMRTEVAALPRRAKNAEGRWAPIDNRLRRTEDGVRPANPVVPLLFAAGTRQDRADRSYARTPLTAGQDTVLAQTVIGGHAISYTWPGDLPEPVLSGPRALYSEALPGIDLLLVAREEGGFAQLLIVKDRTAAANPALATLSYGLKSATAVFRYDASAQRVAVLDGSGKEIGSVPTPFAWDSSGRNPELPEDPDTPGDSVASPEEVLALSGLNGIEPGARQARAPMALAGDGTGTARIEVKVAETGLLSDPEARFPVFVDPTIHPGWAAWTVAYEPHPNSSFWNGTNFGTGTSDARVGHENDTGGTARSFWRMNYSSSLKGATISKASFKVRNHHSWSCEKREFQLWLTGAISSGTTWKKQPGWTTELDRLSFAHGWQAGNCPDAFEEFDIKAAAQKGADAGWASLTLGLRATSERDTQTWRKFEARTAQLTVEYNRPPATPSGVTSAPGGTCNTTTAGATIGKTNVVLSAKSTDPDGNLKGLRFRMWKSGAAVPAGTLVTSLSSGKASITIAAANLADKGVYLWDVRAEDSGGRMSGYYPPPGGNRCAVTIDASAPPPPTVDSEVFPELTDDGQTWAKVTFGNTGAVTFTSPGAAKFRYGIEGLWWKTVDAVGNAFTDSALKPQHTGPNWLNVYALDAAGNQSAVTNYGFYVPPNGSGDQPGDVSGDEFPDILHVNGNGQLFTCVGLPAGELQGCMPASYTTGGALHPAGHWYDAASGRAALITHFSDAYPGDGITDLFAVSPDGTFWLYPGDGYGSFDVTKRIRIILPSDVPAPSAWTQIKAVGDITGDRLPDLFLRSGGSFWVLSGYTGGKFQTATMMNPDAWARRDIVNVADINGDKTPDLLFRNLDNGAMSVRQGKPGPVTGSVDLESLKLGSTSLGGQDVAYGTGWAESAVSTAIGIPDVSGDGIPDIWARSATDGQIRLYNPSRTNTNAAVKVVLSADWRSVRSIG